MTTYQQEGWARRFFKDWFGWVSRSRLKPMVAVAQLLKRHLPNLQTYLKHRITNAVTEGLNSKIQSLKSAARGFRNFQNYRTRILFFCGKLDLYPLSSPKDGRVSRVCSLMAALARRKVAQGKSARQRSMVVESKA